MKTKQVIDFQFIHFYLLFYLHYFQVMNLMPSKATLLWDNYMLVYIKDLNATSFIYAWFEHAHCHFKSGDAVVQYVYVDVDMHIVLQLKSTQTAIFQYLCHNW